MASDDGDPAAAGKSLSSERLPPEPLSPELLSPETVKTLYEVHARELLAFLIGVLRDADIAQEVSQITFRRLLEVGHEARPETIKGWLFKVAFHEAMAYRRRQALQAKTIKQYTTSRESFEVAVPAHDSLVRDEDVTKLKQLLTELPPDQQHVVRQRMYEEKTFAVIARELNVPLGTVLTRMRLAMEKLQKWWGTESQ